MLPEGFALHGEPVVTVYQNHMKEIEWLAGRGYSMMGVTFPATYTGEARPRRGTVSDRPVGEHDRANPHRPGTARILKDLL